MDRIIKKYLKDILFAIEEVEVYLRSDQNNIKCFLKIVCFVTQLNAKSGSLERQ